LGVDPKLIYVAIRAVGVEHVTLSSDAGASLCPNSVECLRMMRGLMRAFGLNEEDLHQVTVTKPAAIVAMN
jgi:hypothetical protein